MFRGCSFFHLNGDRRVSKRLSMIFVRSTRSFTTRCLRVSLCFFNVGRRTTSPVRSSICMVLSSAFGFGGARA